MLLIIRNPQFYPQTKWQLVLFSVFTYVNFNFQSKMSKFDSCKQLHYEL